MFEELSYIGTTLLFCLPLLLLLWLRREFFPILRARLRSILAATGILTLYGSLIWPIALRFKAWSYGSDRISGVKLFDYAYLDDILWWLLVSLLVSSYVALSTYYEEQGVDLVAREVRRLARRLGARAR